MITNEQRDVLAKLVETGAIDGAISVPTDGGTRVVVWGRDAQHKSLEQAFLAVSGKQTAPARIVATREDPHHGTKPGSRTDRALELLTQFPQMTPHEAATRLGISASAVYRALARRGRPCCAACGRPT